MFVSSGCAWSNIYAGTLTSLLIWRHILPPEFKHARIPWVDQ